MSSVEFTSCPTGDKIGREGVLERHLEGCVSMKGSLCLMSFAVGADLMFAGGVCVLRLAANANS